MRNENERVKTAIDNSKHMMRSYWNKMIEQRLGWGGSCYPEYYDEMLEAKILNADWHEASHPAVMEGCTAFKANIGKGLVGIVAIDDIPDNVMLKAADFKGTGFVSMTVKAEDLPKEIEETTETWLILGPEQGVEVVYTFHPGEPVAPSSVAVGTVNVGDMLKKADAKALGFDFAKVDFSKKFTFAINHVPELDEGWRIVVNGKLADEWDFGETEVMRDSYGEPISNSFTRAHENPKERILEKYGITMDQFWEICEAMEDAFIGW